MVIDLNSNLNELKKNQCFIIKFENNDILEELLFKIKKSYDVEIYAKPILLFNEFNLEIDKYLANAVDKIIDKDYFYKELYLEDVTIHNINSKISLLKKGEDKELAFKILRYIYTRDKSIIPYMSLNNKYGYSYPKIDHILGEKNGNGLFEALDFLTEHKLLHPIFFDRCHFCPNCSSAFLNFKEVCPRCFSPNISSEPLIHHFECAYVGPEHEFKYGNKYICPKCDKELFHIGVDYDKPSFVYKCNKCQFDFQDPLVQSTCFNCNSTFDVDNLVLRNMYEYELTVLSENSAIFGFENIFKHYLETSIDIIPPNVFEKYIEIELNRIKRYKKSLSTILMLYLDMNEIYKNINELETIRNIFEQLSELIINFLRTTDMISSYNDATYGILLIETPLEGAKIAATRLKNEIEDLIKVNLKKEYKIDITLKEIKEDSELEELLNIFVEKNV